MAGTITGWEEFSASLEAELGAEFVEDFIRTLQDEQRAEAEVAFTKQREIAERAAAATDRLERISFDGLGELHMRLDPEVYMHWIRKEGRKCWDDKTFVREFKRDNPEVVVNTKRRKTMVTV